MRNDYSRQLKWDMSGKCFNTTDIEKIIEDIHLVKLNKKPTTELVKDNFNSSSHSESLRSVKISLRD